MQWMGAFEGFCYVLLRPLLLCNNTLNSARSTLDTSYMSDEEIAELANSRPKIDANSFYISELHKTNEGRVARIGRYTVAKGLLGDGELELQATNLVQASTRIPVPFCHRIVNGLRGHEHGRWLVQDFVPGRTVWSVWPTLGWWQRFRIALTLRYYIYQLRSMPVIEGTPLFPGPPALNGAPQICKGRLFTSEGAGPFSTYRDLSRWYQNRLLVMQRFGRADLDEKQFDDSVPLVFTHLDLHPLNLILGDDGQLWVIDWADAGWYPSWFEAASMKFFLCNRHIDNLRGWGKWITFIAGTCERPGQFPFIIAIWYSLEVLRSNIVNLIDTTEGPPEPVS